MSSTVVPTPRPNSVATGVRVSGPKLRILAAAAAYVLFAVNFSAYRVFGDGVVYYDFMRRFFGENVPAAHAYAYQWGADIWNAPFWGFAQAVAAITGRHTIADFTLGAVAITVASNAAVTVTALLGWRLLRRLELPVRPSIMLAAIFGTPLYYYATFSPSYTHAVDALALTAAATLLLALVDNDGSEGWNLVALGVCLGWLTVIRYAGFALWPGLLLPVVTSRGVRKATVCAAVAVATSGLLVLLPVLRGIPYGGSPWTLSPNLLVPFEMLFSFHRGLFMWTPLTAISAVGIGLFIARERGPRRSYVIGLATASLMLMVPSAAGNLWDGGWSFSNRFLTCLFPVFLIGLAEAWARRPRLVGMLAAAAVAWSLFIGFNHVFGVSQQDGVNDIVGLFINGSERPTTSCTCSFHTRVSTISSSCLQSASPESPGAPRRCVLGGGRVPPSGGGWASLSGGRRAHWVTRAGPAQDPKSDRPNGCRADGGPR